MPATKQKSPVRRAPVKRPRTSRRRKKRARGARTGTILLALLLLIGVIALVPKLIGQLRQSQRTAREEPTPDLHTAVLPHCPYDTANFIDNPDGTISYEDETYTSLPGIDVSSHQGEIDWSAAAQDGISFAMVRLGWRGYSAGDLCKDELALENLQAARDNGLLVGAYFYSQAVNPEEAREEAELALEALDGFQLDLPLYYDWELATNPGSRSASMDHSTLTQCALAFCSTVEEAGYDAGIYFYPSLGEDTYDMASLTDYAFWLSQPDSRPSVDLNFGMWQYTYEGQVAGISTHVDRDIMFVPKESEHES